MATGNNLIHRGRLTRSLAKGLASLDGGVRVDNVRVMFYASNNAEPLVTMPLGAALASVAFDVAKQGGFAWGHADTLLVSTSGKFDFDDLIHSRRAE